MPGAIDTLLFQGLDHVDADAILDRGNGIEEFQLEQDVGFCAGLFGHAVHPDQRGVADGFGNGV